MNWVIPWVRAVLWCAVSLTLFISDVIILVPSAHCLDSIRCWGSTSQQQTYRGRAFFFYLVFVLFFVFISWLVRVTTRASVLLICCCCCFPRLQCNILHPTLPFPTLVPCSCGCKTYVWHPTLGAKIFYLIKRCFPCVFVTNIWHVFSLDYMEISSLNFTRKKIF